MCHNEQLAQMRPLYPAKHFYYLSDALPEILMFTHPILSFLVFESQRYSTRQAHKS